MAELHIVSALFLGAIIGLYEVFLIHRDTLPLHRLKHSFQAFIFSLVFCFISMNTAFVLHLIPALENIPLLGNVHVLRAAVGFLAAVKIHIISKVIPSSGMSGIQKTGETWFHSLLIGALIVAAPYVYPFIEGMLPEWAKL